MNLPSSWDCDFKSRTLVCVSRGEAVGVPDSKDTAPILCVCDGLAACSQPQHYKKNFLGLSRKADDLTGLFPSLTFIEKLEFIIG